MLNNKENFKDRPEIYNLLTALETAHQKQDELALSIVLTQLEQKNIKIIVDKKAE